MNREFVHGSIRYIEMPDTYKDFSGTSYRMIPASTAVFVAKGTDSFQSFYGPANKLGLVNTLGEEVYMFEFASPYGDKLEIQTESNQLHVVRRPAATVKATMS
jgi:hypothetical protein